MSETCHCPEEYPDQHEQDIDLCNTPAHILPTAAFFYIPLSYDLYLRNQQAEIDRLELQEKWPGFVISCAGFLRGQLIRLLNTESSPSRRFVTLDANYVLHGYLHDGGIGTIKKSTRKLQNILFDMGRMPKELYLCYLTCPICEEKKGGDKVLLLRHWVESKTLSKRIKSQGSSQWPSINGYTDVMQPG